MNKGYVQLALEFLANLFGFLKGRQEANNAPEIKQAVKAERQQNAIDEVRRLQAILADPNKSEGLKQAALRELQRIDS